MNDFTLVKVDLSIFFALGFGHRKHLKVETTALDQVHSLINAKSILTVLKRVDW